MPSEMRQTPPSFLRDVLADGARPFRYRSSVRALLGVADDDHDRAAFTPALPPVGFVYARRQPEVELPLPEYLDVEIAGFAPYDDWLGQDEHPAAPVPEPTRHGHASPANAGQPIDTAIVLETRADGRAAEQATNRLVELLPKVRREPALAGPVGPPQRPDPPVGWADVRIPGSSGRADSRVPGQAGGVAASPAVSDVRLPELEPPAIAPRAGMARGATQTTTAGAVEMVGRGDGAPAPRPTARVQPSVTLSSCIDREHVLDSAPAPCSLSRPEIDAATMAAAGRIEQIRSSVRELESKRASPRAPALDEAPQAWTHDRLQPQQVEAAAPQPVQQLVVVKRSAQEVRAPRAFWERRYLRRFHLRILR